MARRPPSSTPPRRRATPPPPAPEPEPPPKRESLARAKGALSTAHLPDQQRKAITDAQKLYRIALNSEDRTTDKGKERIARAREAFYAARAAAGITVPSKGGDGTRTRATRPKSTKPAAPNPPAKPGMAERAANSPAKPKSRTPALSPAPTPAASPRSRRGPKPPVTPAPPEATANGTGERLEIATEPAVHGVPSSALAPSRAVPKPPPGRQPRRKPAAPA